MEVQIISKEFQIISKEIIKPSSPTPPSLRTYKLSVIDQTTVQFYIPMILFYPPGSDENPRKTSDFLKQSLPGALTSFYPLAGRIRNDLSCVDCNDDGVTFIEAKVGVEMSVALEQQNTLGLQPLLPCKPHDRASESKSQVLLAIQVNYFECGGIAVGVCLWHEIGDASSLGSFLNIWGEISRGTIDENDKIAPDGVIVDCTLLFPPQDYAAILEGKMSGDGAASKNGKKRFVIDGHKLASLRRGMSPGTTRFEAVSALIWAAAITTMEDEDGTKVVNAIFPMNLRKMLDPPLPEQSLGNIVQGQFANKPHLPNNVADYNALAQAIHAAKRMMNNEYIRRCHDAEGGYLQFIRDIVREIGLDTVRLLSFNSWRGFRFYEADIGWGKPIWICPALSHDFSCILTDTRDGEGIEAWIGLPKEDMEKLLQDPGIIAYTSFSPSMSSSYASF